MTKLGCCKCTTGENLPNNQTGTCCHHPLHNSRSKAGTVLVAKLIGEKTIFTANSWMINIV